MARTRHLKITVEGKVYDVVVEDVSDDDDTFYPSPGLASQAARPHPAAAAALAPAAAEAPKAADAAASADDKVAPMGGMIVELSVKQGEAVKAGQQLLIMEAMKMKQVVTAHKDGTVQKIHVEAGQAVDAGQPLVAIA
jgi:biotin carboxyl carrier protein